MKQEANLRSSSEWMEEVKHVDANLRAITKTRHELDANEARFLRHAKRIRIWKAFGYVSLLDYMERVLGYKPRAAYDRLRVAFRLDALAQTERALERNEINYSAARELTRVATAETEQAWLNKVRGMNLRQIEEAVAGRVPGDLPEDAPRPEERTYRISFEVNAETYAWFRDTRLQMNKEHGMHLDDNDFIHAVMDRVMSPPDPERARHQIAVTLCEGCNRAWQDGGGAVIEIDQRAAERATCAAEHIGSLDADDPARAKQDVPPAVRRLVFRRDHSRCRFPGCRSSMGLDVHHIRFREHGGTHDPRNLIVLCSAHHRAVHDGLVVIHGNARTAHFERNDFMWEDVVGESSQRDDDSAHVGTEADGTAQDPTKRKAGAEQDGAHVGTSG